MTNEIEIPEGFTKHDGGECPVSPDTTVVVLLRNGTVTVPLKAEFYSDPFLDWWKWQGRGDYRIIAYRISEGV